MVGEFQPDDIDITRNDTNIRSPLSGNDDDHDEDHNEDANATEILEDSFPTPESTGASLGPSPHHHNIEDIDLRQEEGLHQLSAEDLESRLTQLDDKALKALIGDQIDFEIRLKHREVDLVDDEIGKCEAQMIALRKYYEVSPTEKIKNEPIDFTTKYSHLLNSSHFTNQYLSNFNSSLLHQRSAGLSQPPSSNGSIDAATFYRTRSTTSSLRPSSFRSNTSSDCIYRRTDGVLVKLTCLECHRSNFSSAQGFLNHCRIAHAKEFTSQDAAALQCGEALPESEQDEEGLQSLIDLSSKNLDPSRNLNVREIKFDEISGITNGQFKSNNTTTDAGEDSNIANINRPPTASTTVVADQSIKKKGKSQLVLKKRLPEHLILKMTKNGSTDTEIQSLLNEMNARSEEVPELFDGEEIDYVARARDEKLEAEEKERKRKEKEKNKHKRKSSVSKQPPSGKSNGKSMGDLKRRKSRSGVGISQQTISVPPKARERSTSPAAVSPYTASSPLTTNAPFKIKLKLSTSSRSESPLSDSQNLNKKVDFDLGEPDMESNRSDNLKSDGLTDAYSENESTRGRDLTSSAEKLTASQRRRLPSNASPSRTRSRGLK